MTVLLFWPAIKKVFPRTERGIMTQDSNDSITEILFKRHLLNNKSNPEAIPFKQILSNFLSTVPILKNFTKIDSRQEEINFLIQQQKECTSYGQWHETSLKLDYLLKNNEWKHELESDLYDYKVILHNLQQLRKARLEKDNKKLLYLVRTTWIRNLGGMGSINLYRYSHVGTKKLIEEYINECEDVLEFLTSKNSVVDDRYCLGMLVQTRKNIGRTALVLSGGGCFGLFHIGVLSTLLESDLLPRIVSGSSAGAIMASILCSRTNEESVPFLETIIDQKFNIFEDYQKKETILQHLSRFLKYGTWFDNAYLKETMIGFLGDLTFKECYNRTGKILNITVSPVSIHEQPRLLNYLTAPTVLIWSAVCASCSLPGVFAASTIYEKSPRSNEIKEWNGTSMKYVDGSVDNDLPISRLSEMFNVDHIIACQVNPHVFPFLKMTVTSVGGQHESALSLKIKELLTSMYGIFSTEVMHYLTLIDEIGIARNLATKLKSVLAQQYSGDITILPDLKISEVPLILINPTPEFILDAIIRGAKATWPKVTMIRNHCSVEFGLDKAISKLRSRLISTKYDSVYPLVNSPMMTDLENESDDYLKESQNNEFRSHPRHKSISGYTNLYQKGRLPNFNSSTALHTHMVPQSPLSKPKLGNRRRTLSSANFTTDASKSQPISPVFHKYDGYFDENKTPKSNGKILKFNRSSSVSGSENSPFKTSFIKKYYQGDPYMDTNLNIDVNEITARLMRNKSSSNINKSKPNMNLPAQSPNTKSLRNSSIGLNLLHNNMIKEQPKLRKRHSYKNNKNMSSSPEIKHSSMVIPSEMLGGSGGSDNHTDDEDSRLLAETPIISEV